MERLHAAERISDAITHKSFADPILIEELVKESRAGFDRELDPPRLLLPSESSVLSLHHGEGKVVQARAQGVKDVASQETYDRRNWLVQPQPELDLVSRTPELTHSRDWASGLIVTNLGSQPSEMTKRVGMSEPPVAKRDQATTPSHAQNE